MSKAGKITGTILLAVLALQLALVLTIRHKQHGAPTLEATATDSNYMEVVATRLPLEVADSGKPRAIGNDTAPTRHFRLGL